MTTEQLRQYSAEEIRGWKLFHPPYSDHFVYLGTDNNIVMKEADWHPDTDDGQLRQVEEKVYDERRNTTVYHQGEFVFVQQMRRDGTILKVDGHTIAQETLARLRLAVQVHQEVTP